MACAGGVLIYYSRRRGVTPARASIEGARWQQKDRSYKTRKDKSVLQVLSQGSKIINTVHLPLKEFTNFLANYLSPKIPCKILSARNSSLFPCADISPPPSICI